MDETLHTVPARPLHPLTDAPTRVSDTANAPLPAAAIVSMPAYEILQEIGRGGMGVVYLARQRSLNRLVALKVILSGPHASDIDKGRFRIEGEAAGRLHHPNIVQVYDVGEHGGFAYIAYELIEGQTLRAYLEQHPPTPRQSAHIVATIARAIQHAHENGIIHRDLKPGNILLSNVESNSKSGSVGSTVASVDSAFRIPHSALLPKVTDFGLAKELAVESGLTITGMACGTPNYMSPEQVRGASDQIGPQTDVYGLGAILYELLTGAPPFSGINDPVLIAEQIKKSDPMPARRVRSDTPRDLDVIASKCLEKDPARRYQTAAELADDLERFLAGRPIHARAVSIIERSWRWCKRNPWAAAVLVITSLGFATTGTLAARLARSERVEREARRDAENALVVAHNAQIQAEHLKTVADQQADIAKTEQRRAEKNQRMARSVLRSALEEFNKQPLFNDPAMHSLRSVLLRHTRSYVREITPDIGNDPEILEELSRIGMWVAYMEYLNKNVANAATEYLAAAAVARKWVAADPNDPHAKLTLADALTNAGRAEFATEQHKPSIAHLQEAVGILEGLLTQNTRKENAHRAMIHTRAPLAHILRQTGQPAEALAVEQETVNWCHDWIARFGLAPQNASHLAESHLAVAFTLMSMGKQAEAETHLMKAIGLFDWAGTGEQHSTPNKQDATDARLALVNLYRSRGWLDMANDTLTTAASMARKAGDNPATQLQLARIESAHGDMLRRANQFDRAEPLLDRAIKTAEALMRRPTESKRARELWVNSVVNRAHVYNATGRHRDAIGEWSRLAKEDPNPDNRLRHEMCVYQSLVFAGEWRDAATGAEKMDSGERPGWYWTELARVWCRISMAAADDSSLTSDERVMKAETFTVKAVHCLERAKRQGFFQSPRSLKMVETERDFTIVRVRFNPRD